MEQEVVKAILDEIVESITLNDYLPKSPSEGIDNSLVSSIITKTDVKSSATCDTEKDFKEGNQGGNEDVTMQSETENNLGYDDTVSSDPKFQVPEERKSKDFEPEIEELKPSDSNLRGLECIEQKNEPSASDYDPEAIEPYSPQLSLARRIITKSENNKNRFEHLEIRTRGVTAENPSMATNIEPSVIVINNNPDESATSSDSDFHDAGRSLQRSQSDDKIYKPNLNLESPRRISKKILSRSLRNKSRYRQKDIEEPSSSSINNIVPSVIVVKDNLKADHPEEKIQITQLSESPGNNRRRWRYLQEDIAGPSTSSNIEAAVIVINDYSNESSISPYSTGEMQRRTERNFAFLSDSDYSDTEASENLGYQNRAYEPSEEIELRNEAQMSNSSVNAIDSELRSNDLNNSYIWSTTGLLKLTQVICCITMYITVGLCRFSSRYIQVHCIIGACISSFLLFVYSYRIEAMYWKSYKIRLLLSEFLYLVIYTACDASFAIIKFEYDQTANERERTAVMILMISTLIAASTYCYDTMECFSFMEQAGKDNPEEKRFLLSLVPTCSQSSRAEICDIFHTCIL